MALPETVRVKLSSEAAGAISITPVVIREMPLRELVELMLVAVGKDSARIRELLLRGSLVSGASRFRWSGWTAGIAEIDALLATFPNPDPARAFTPDRCVRAVLSSPAARIDLPREAGLKRRLFARGTFWEELMRLAEAGEIEYVEYSYRDRADRYRIRLNSAGLAVLREHSRSLVYSTLQAQVCGTALDTIDFLVER